MWNGWETHGEYGRCHGGQTLLRSWVDCQPGGCGKVRAMRWRRDNTPEPEPIVAPPSPHGAGWRTERADPYAPRGLAEDLDQPLYDRVHYPVDGIGDLGELAFFLKCWGTSDQLGPEGADVVKTRAYTNGDAQSVLPNKAFQLRGLAHRLYPSTDPIVERAWTELARYGEFQLRIIDKPCLSLPLSALPLLRAFEWRPNYVDAEPVREITVTETRTRGQLQRRTLIRTLRAVDQALVLKMPLVIEPYQTFVPIIRVPALWRVPKAFDVELLLYGILRRPGQ
jgi:hypothetical protein